MEIGDQQHQEDLERLQKLRPIDDDFMRCLFKDNIPLVEDTRHRIIMRPFHIQDNPAQTRIASPFSINSLVFEPFQGSLRKY